MHPPPPEELDVVALPDDELALPDEDDVVTLPLDDDVVTPPLDDDPLLDDALPPPPCPMPPVPNSTLLLPQPPPNAAAPRTPAPTSMVSKPRFISTKPPRWAASAAPGPSVAATGDRVRGGKSTGKQVSAGADGWALPPRALIQALRGR